MESFEVEEDVREAGAGWITFFDCAEIATYVGADFGGLRDGAGVRRVSKYY